MIPLLAAIVILVAFASTLALAEASISRMTAVRAMALREQGHGNAALLERIENDPARYLNAIYLSVMFAQNGSAILVAVATERYCGQAAIMAVSVLFTLAYFVVVEAMSKTFAILHSDRVALLLAPFVFVLGQVLTAPTRMLIGLANLLLPGKGLERGPFVTQEEIRSMADVGHAEGVIEEHEREIIHSVFKFGDRTVAQIMVPRPDIVAIDVESSVSAAVDLTLEHGLTRLPAYRGDLDHIEGVLHAKDLLDLLHRGRKDVPLAEVMRSVRFVPETKRAAELLREMQKEKFHLAIVSDEYGTVAGVITIEDLLEELVGEIDDEYDEEASDLVPLEGGRWRINATLPITDLNAALGTSFPHDRWNTVGGLLFGLLGRVPAEGESVVEDGWLLSAEKVRGRRIVTVLASHSTDQA